MTLLAALLLSATCFIPSAAKAAGPMPVREIRRAGEAPREWYEEQARLWKEELAARPQNPSGWQSYFLAVEYSYRGRSNTEGETHRRLDQLLEEMGRAVPDSWQYYYLRERRTPWSAKEEKLSLLQEAYRRCPDCGAVSEVLAGVYEVAGKPEEARPVWEALYRSRDLAPGLIDYNYNILASTDADAILITNGDNDTYPALMLQRALNVRPDVLVLNIYLAQNDRDYLRRSLADRGIDIDPKGLPDGPDALLNELCRSVVRSGKSTPVYVALTVPSETRRLVEDHLYMVGLASLYSEKPVDNLALLERNLEHRFRIDSLYHDWYSEQHISTVPEVRRLNANYTYPFALLAEHCAASGDSFRAGRWRELALKVAQDSGSEILLRELRERFAPKSPQR